MMSDTSADITIASGHCTKPELHAFEREDADRVAADADIGRMPETDHAAITHDQIEARGRDRQDDDAREQAEHEIVLRSRPRKAAPGTAPMTSRAMKILRMVKTFLIGCLRLETILQGAR